MAVQELDLVQALEEILEEESEQEFNLEQALEEILEGSNGVSAAATPVEATRVPEPGRPKPARARDLANERKQNAKRAKTRSDLRAAASATAGTPSGEATTAEGEVDDRPSLQRRVRLNCKTTRKQAAELGFD